jgi:hypothetical protein
MRYEYLGVTSLALSAAIAALPTVVFARACFVPKMVKNGYKSDFAY